MEGIAIGVVTANWEKDHPGMVQVEYLLGATGEMKTGWISVMTSFGGASYGSYHLPEVGNSVVLGFELGNPNCPIVMGCLWSQDNPLPPGAANEKNSKLLWKTKSGYQFVVEEEEKTLSFSDPEGKNTMIWSTKDQCMVLDVEGKIKLNIGGEEFLTLEKDQISVAEGLTITVNKDLSVEAKNITLSPKQNTKIQGIKTEVAPSQEISLKSGQIAAEGTMLEWKAQASQKLQSGGMLEMKGALLKLN